MLVHTASVNLFFFFLLLCKPPFHFHSPLPPFPGPSPSLPFGPRLPFDYFAKFLRSHDPTSATFVFVSSSRSHLHMSSA
ncbi:hypothetical protein BGW80DRAFT_297584 [Lactifluus volemus]|nr:hypothetical protein BGW80DRAFT_297584 [Lactifluus volemus]